MVRLQLGLCSIIVRVKVNGQFGYTFIGDKVSIHINLGFKVQ